MDIGGVGSAVHEQCHVKQLLRAKQREGLKSGGFLNDYTW
jgi:hypothetical protein